MWLFSSQTLSLCLPFRHLLFTAVCSCRLRGFIRAAHCFTGHSYLLTSENKFEWTAVRVRTVKWSTKRQNVKELVDNSHNSNYTWLIVKKMMISAALTNETVIKKLLNSNLYFSGSSASRMEAYWNSILKLTFVTEGCNVHACWISMCILSSVAKPLLWQHWSGCSASVLLFMI